MHNMEDIINVAVVNFKVESGEKQKNLSRIKGFVESSAKRGADLIVLPELCLDGYDYFINEDVTREQKVAAAELIPGPSTNAVAEIAKKYGVYVVFGMAEKLEENAKDIYNSAAVIGPDGIIGSYQKIHPYGSENGAFKKGEKPFMFDTKWGKIAVGVCYDSYQFPELVRYYVWKGARLYLNPTAAAEEVPNEGSRHAFVRCYQPHLEYQVLSSSLYIASSNLTGREGGCYYGGGSMVIGPKTNAFEEVEVTTYIGDVEDYQVGVKMGTIDLSLAVRHQCVPDPYCGEPDYRPDLYAKLFNDEFDI